MRLIDADSIRKSVEYIPWCEYDAVQRCIDEEPTIDAVPVVRCRDCVHAREPQGYEVNMYMPGVLICTQERGDTVAGRSIVTGEEYCSGGERRGEGSERR